MVTANRKTLSLVLVIIGIVSLVFGAVFMAQGFIKSNLITDSMRLEGVTYGSADGAIEGLIDTPSEAEVMASTLREHRMENYGLYTELGRDDPGRDMILKAMTMENSLNMAVLGYGVTDIAKASGGYMLVMGIGLIVSGILVIRTKRITIE